jgi:hypothetical protein
VAAGGGARAKPGNKKREKINENVTGAVEKRIEETLKRR